MKCGHIWGIRKEDINNMCKDENIKLTSEQLERVFDKIDNAFPDWYESILNVIKEIKESD